MKSSGPSGESFLYRVLNLSVGSLRRCVLPASPTEKRPKRVYFSLRLCPHHSPSLMANPDFTSVKGPATWRVDGRPRYKYNAWIVEGKGPKDRKDPKGCNRDVPPILPLQLPDKILNLHSFFRKPLHSILILVTWRKITAYSISCQRKYRSNVP